MIQSEIQAIENVYALLSRYWLRELDADTLFRLQQEPLKSAFQELGGTVPTESIEDLAIEYCRLFVGPREQLPPIQSVWKHAELESECAVSVREFANLIGYESSSESMFDHLGIQLDMMSHVLRQLRQTEGAEPYQEIAGEFYRRHLVWPIEKFLPAITERADLTFYSSLARVTQQFLEAELTAWR
ncbi:MAG: molecular chaperone [Rubripirellula sp.]